MFRGYIQSKKKPKAYYYMLDEFMKDYGGRNIAEITAEDIEEFMLDRWSDSKANTIRVRHAQLNGLFNHAIKILMKKGSPTFHNPMSLITQPGYEYTEVKFLKPEQIRKVINAVNLKHHWLAMAILASTGIRPGELLKLKVRDKKGQVLILHEPKSGNKNEWVVIPKFVERVLGGYISSNNLQPEDRIIPLSYNKLNEKVVRKYSKKAGSHFTPKYFRNWCAMYWYENGEEGMVRFILRLNSDQYIYRDIANPLIQKILEDKYIDPCTIEEVHEKIKKLEGDLFL